MLQVIYFAEVLHLLDRVKFQHSFTFDFLLIHEQISALVLTTPMFSTKALVLNVLGIELSDPLIVELQPLLSTCFDEAEVVTIFSRANMYDYTTKLVLKVVTIFNFLLFLYCVVINIERMWEFPS
jgi:hypothetical protein